MRSGLPLALVVLAASACITVETRTTADVIVETATGHDHYTYEATEVFDVSTLAIACILTGIWYGGACWAYLAIPFEDQERTVLAHANEDMSNIGDCAHLMRVQTEARGYNEGGLRKARLVTLRGKTLRIDDAMHTLCARPSAPKAASPPPLPFDPANP